MSAAKIVLIEDNPADVFLVEMALKENDISYEMTNFSNGEEAVRCLCPADGRATDLPRPDAILLDLNTPKSDGFEVLGKLRQTPYLAGVPIAIITSSQAAIDKRRIALLGLIRYIEKPSQLDAFLSTVGHAVQEMLQ